MKMRMGHFRLADGLGPEGWKKIIAGLLDGIGSRLSPSTARTSRLALDELRASILASETGSQRKASAKAAAKLIAGKPCFRAALRRYVTKDLEIKPEQWDILFGELCRRAGDE